MHLAFSNCYKIKYKTKNKIIKYLHIYETLALYRYFFSNCNVDFFFNFFTELLILRKQFPKPKIQPIFLAKPEVGN